MPLDFADFSRGNVGKRRLSAHFVRGRCVKTACGITLDIGRQRLTGRDLKGLLDLAEEKGVLAANAAMRSGEIVNPSENRPALHTALRDPSVSAPFHTEVMKALNQVCRFAEDVRSGLF